MSILKKIAVVWVFLVCSQLYSTGAASMHNNVSRRFLKTAASLNTFVCLSLFNPTSSLALTTLTGSVNIAPGNSLPPGGNVALYFTVREDVGVWQSAVRNFKPPPILSKRVAVEKITFPYEFSINSNEDSTEEGTALYNQWSSGKNPLLVSARLDEDGVAATRGPNDLIGRGAANYERKGETSTWTQADIQLTGRGVAGKLITGVR